MFPTPETTSSRTKHGMGLQALNQNQFKWVKKTDVISEQFSQIGKGERIDDDPANGQHRYLENQIAINGPETVSNETDS